MGTREVGISDTHTDRPQTPVGNQHIHPHIHGQKTHRRRSTNKQTDRQTDTDAGIDTSRYVQTQTHGGLPSPKCVCFPLLTRKERDSRQEMKGQEKLAGRGPTFIAIHGAQLLPCAQCEFLHVDMFQMQVHLKQPAATRPPSW